jgi:hypothetical protein
MSSTRRKPSEGSETEKRVKELARLLSDEIRTSLSLSEEVELAGKCDGPFECGTYRCQGIF